MKEGGSEAPACWSPDGKSFRLRKPASFLNEVFSACFDSLSFSVFEQRLRAWGFVRHPTDAPLGVVTSEQFTYSHPFFVEGKKPLITRLSGEMKVSNQNRRAFLWGLVVLRRLLFAFLPHLFLAPYLVFIPRANPYPWNIPS